MLGWFGIGLIVIMIVSVTSLDYAEQQSIGEYSETNINSQSHSQLVSINSTNISNYINTPDENTICDDYKVEMKVNNHVLYAHDKLITKGNAPPEAKLEGRLIPLDGMTFGKMVNIPLEDSQFEYLLHQYGPDDEELRYAVLVSALIETNDGETCLSGDYEIVQYRGVRR